MLKNYPSAPLPPSPPQKKGFGSLHAPRSGFATTIMVCFAHLLILECPDHHQNLISSSLYYPAPFYKISSQTVHNFLSNVVHRQTDRQTDKQTNATKNITSFAKEVINKVLDHYLHHYLAMLPLLWCLFAHLLTLEYPDHYYNLISSSLYYPGPLHKISSQSVHNFLTNVVHRQTDKQTNQRYQKHNLLSFARM